MLDEGLLHQDPDASEVAFAPPPMRDRLPTLPCDLSEYARIHTGPASWSAETGQLLEGLSGESLDALFEGVESGPLFGVRGADVPRVAVCVFEPMEARMTHAEAFVFALIDGRTPVDELLFLAGLAPSEVLAALCSLCARGMIRMK
jgi:hypothetical protein